MLHTIKIDDSQLAGRQLIEELRKNKHVIFEDSIVSEPAPEGYMKLEEFRKEAKASAKKILKDNGLY